MLLVNLLAALNFANVFQKIKKFGKLKNVKNVKNVTKILKNVKKTFFSHLRVRLSAIVSLELHGPVVLLHTVYSQAEHFQNNSNDMCRIELQALAGI